ncbi:unnamed protein product [Didymodactylos carnosus]|uniref:Uncharacterized protein n=1 Tax=Didymodactylos carnosus TaxID=1234261 RepID=A0A815D7T2_9BILA|nr:unnamed protein product [Didymodactylos carnosus]CAF1289930.1 unnamed protein product [Didymodactylos carnosus]CAF3915466.1 unnamed protein product [Didymodactylos carnosus]CAF4094951.1 unnamed protein product [Didymodactylos carnosus]
MQSKYFILRKLLSNRAYLFITTPPINTYNTAAHIPFQTRVPQHCIRLSNLPLLSSIIKLVENNKPLQGYTILNIQHQLGDVTAQTEALIALGALPSNLYFLPPPYTHHREFELFVFNYYGVPKENFFQSSSYRLCYNYDKYRLLQVIFELRQMIKLELLKERQKHHNLLVLDDGGCFSEALATLFDIHNEILDPDELIKNLPLLLKTTKSDATFIISYFQSIEIRLIEQTSRGIFKYVDQQNISKTLNKFGISIIDVASSEPKKRLEPPIIAEACLNMLSYIFYDAPNHLRIPKPLKSQNCLLLGYGAIGQAVGYALTHEGDLGLFSKNSVKVWDRDVTRHKVAQDNGFDIFNQWNNKEEFDYIIGCTGRCSLSLSSLSLLRNNCYLISVSSAAIEFPFNDMIEHSLLNGNKNPIKISLSDIQLNELNNENIHRNITFQIEDQRNITVVNGGMPITFLGILNPAIPEKFDLTVSCMIAASIQAVGTKQQLNDKQQIIPLDSKYSKFICDWFDNNMI